MRVFLSCFLSLLLLALPRLSAGTEGSQAIPPGREVVLSEFPLFPAPGPDGTWVELYNRSDKEVDLGRAFLSSNGHRLVTFPKPFPVPGRALMLVRFISPRGEPWKAEPGPANSLLVEAPAAVPLYGGKQRVKPGYLSLERPVESGLDELADYVRWGRFPQASDQSYEGRASKAGIWDRVSSQPLYVGLAPNPVDVPLPSGQMICVRMDFRPEFDQSAALTLLSLRDATPGQANRVLPAPIPTVEDGSSTYAGDGLAVGCELPFCLLSDGIQAAGRYRFQLARDPQFAVVTATAETRDGQYTFPADKVPPGGYYVRCQWQVGGAVTAWMPPVYIRAR